MTTQVIVLNGGSSAGKTGIARCLQAVLPQPWIRLEGFYSRVQQSSLRAGGQLTRNRIGFQIVTSKPVRLQ